MFGYRVIDKQTGQYANKTFYTTRARASRAVDRLDNKYGACRYHVVELYKFT